MIKLSRIYTPLLLAVLLTIPAISFAAGAPAPAPATVDGLAGGQTGGFGLFIKGLADVVNGYLIPFFIALCVLAFIYGVFTYFIAGGADEEKRAQGRSMMLYAILGFVAIVALWGIVTFVAGAFGFNTGTSINIKTTGPGIGT